MCTPLIVRMAGVSEQTFHMLCIYHCLHCCVFCSSPIRCAYLHAPLVQSSLKCGYYFSFSKAQPLPTTELDLSLCPLLVTHVQVPSVPLFLSHCCLPHPGHMLLIHCTIDISAHTLLKMWLSVLYCSHVSCCLRQVLSVMILLFTDT